MSPQMDWIVLKSLLGIEMERSILLNSLNLMCRMMVCNYGCWHSYLEMFSTNPLLHNRVQPLQPCYQSCPYCDGSRSKIIKPIRKAGLKLFLSVTMINNYTEPISPSTLVKKLLDFPNVGRIVYGRNTAVKAEKSSDAAITIMQLFATDIIHLQVKEGTSPESYCMLSVTQDSPNYLLDNYWTYIDQIE